MSVRNYNKEIELEDIHFMIEDIRRIEKRLKQVESNLLDMESVKQRELIN